MKGLKIAVLIIVVICQVNYIRTMLYVHKARAESEALQRQADRMKATNDLDERTNFKEKR